MYEKYQNQFSMMIYPGEWFQLIDNCRLNFNNNEQMLFPDRYGEHFFDRRTKINTLISKFEVGENSQTKKIIQSPFLLGYLWYWKSFLHREKTSFRSIACHQ